MRSDIPMKRISVRVTKDEREMLEEECRRTGMTISDVVREAIRWKINS